MAETVELSTPRCFAEASIRVRDKEEADMIIEAIPKVAQVGYVFVACEADKRKRVSNPGSIQNIVHITSHCCECDWSGPAITAREFPDVWEKAFAAVIHKLLEISSSHMSVIYLHDDRGITTPISITLSPAMPGTC